VCRQQQPREALLTCQLLLLLPLSASTAKNHNKKHKINTQKTERKKSATRASPRAEGKKEGKMP
jgi:hypothetical protein